MPTSCGRAEGELRARSCGRADGGAEAKRRQPTPAVAGELRGRCSEPPGLYEAFRTETKRLSAEEKKRLREGRVGGSKSREGKRCEQGDVKEEVSSSIRQ